MQKAKDAAAEALAVLTAAEQTSAVDPKAVWMEALNQVWDRSSAYLEACVTDACDRTRDRLGARVPIREEAIKATWLEAEQRFQGYLRRVMPKVDQPAWEPEFQRLFRDTAALAISVESARLIWPQWQPSAKVQEILAGRP
jgi:hypothetical protein